MAVSLADIADAVVDELDAGGPALWPAMTVSRSYLHEFHQHDSSLRCSVAPASLAAKQLARGTIKLDKALIVTISKRVPDTDKATIKPYVAGLEAILDYYADVRELMAGAQVVAAVAQEQLYDADLLYQQSLFVSIFTIGFQTFAS